MRIVPSPSVATHPPRVMCMSPCPRVLLCVSRRRVLAFPTRTPWRLARKRVSWRKRRIPSRWDTRLVIPDSFYVRWLSVSWREVSDRAMIHWRWAPRRVRTPKMGMRLPLVRWLVFPHRDVLLLPLVISQATATRGLPPFRWVSNRDNRRREYKVWRLVTRRLKPPRVPTRLRVVHLQVKSCSLLMQWL